LTGKHIVKRRRLPHNSLDLITGREKALMADSKSQTETLGSDNQTDNDHLSEKDIQSANESMNSRLESNSNQSNGAPKPEPPAPARLREQPNEDLQPTEILVDWDENDPMHPHSMSEARRWLIVLVVSLGSLCVYVMTFSASDSLTTLSFTVNATIPGHAHHQCIH
jgi:hypothetical protein